MHEQDQNKQNSSSPANIAPATTNEASKPTKIKLPYITSTLATLSLIAGIALALITGVIFVFSAYQGLSQKQQVASTPPPSPSPTLTPDQNREPNGSAATANWKTYIDNPYQLTFNYPSDWIVNIRDERTKGGSYFIGIRPISPTPESKTFNLVFIGITKWDKTLDNYINNNLCDTPDVCASADKAESVLIDGISAKKIKNPPAPIPSQFVLFKKDNFLYSFEIILDKSYEGLLDENEKVKIFDQILSTFKFIEKNGTLSDIITYTTPLGWTEETYEANAVSVISLRSPDYKENNYPFITNGAEIYIYKRENKNNMKLIDFVEGGLPTPLRKEIKNVKEVISGTNTFYNLYYCYEGCFDHYYIQHGENIIEFEYVCAPDCSTKNELESNKYQKVKTNFLRSVAFKTSANN